MENNKTLNLPRIDTQKMFFHVDLKRGLFLWALLANSRIDTNDNILFLSLFGLGFAMSQSIY